MSPKLAFYKIFLVNFFLKKVIENVTEGMGSGREKTLGTDADLIPVLAAFYHCNKTQ